MKLSRTSLYVITSLAICVTSVQGQSLPPSVTDWLDKLSDSGPGLTRAQKAKKQAEFDAITTPPRNLVANPPGRASLPVICGRGEMRSSANRFKLETSQGKSVHIRIAFVYAPEEPQANGRGSLVNAMHLIDLKDLCAVVIAPAGRQPNGENRFIASVYNGNGKDVGLELIKGGYAWHWAEMAQGTQHPAAYRAYELAQKWVKDWREGIFVSSNPIPPWDFSGIGSKTLPQ